IVSVFSLEMIWNIAFFFRLLTGQSIGGVAEYMFNPQFPLPLRILSLFHVWLLPLWIWMLHRIGYERRAWNMQVIVGWTALLLTYCSSTSSENINWVYGLGSRSMILIRSGLYLAILLIVFPGGVYFPTHWVISRIAAASRRL